MREFVYFSSRARTSGNFADLMKAGRIDIACHVVIASLFLSHDIRRDVKLHMVFNGPPDPPKHLEFIYDENMPISKKDVSGLIKRMLYKCKPNIRIEAFPGCFIEKKSFTKLLEELSANKTLYVLDKDGKDIRQVSISENPVFILGDHEGLPRKEMKRFKHVEKISLGKNMYLASQAVVIVNNELDRR
jgi:tRNA (pseudouridine54-N1)-methyltransferase